ncbi:P-loop containing nucleoside triphosphate hydrolase protein [Marasmius fiardii PR-910]|nr:P-loop containing nucleoside triphosphate hydrolase protein [Marasmius fiardii PR-910]
MVQKGPCPQVLATGSCSDAGCQYEHTVRNCDICQLVFMNANEYRQHFNSKRHRNKMKRGPEATTIILYCPICQLYIQSMASWTSHVRGGKHATKARNQGLAPGIEPEVHEEVPNHEFCVICQMQIPIRFRGHHQSSKRHKTRAQFLTFRSVVEEAEKDKNDVTVKGDLDFAIVDPSAAEKGTTMQATIARSDPSSQIHLVQYRLASSQGKQIYSPFTISGLGQGQSSMSVPYSSSLPFRVTMSSKYLGRYEDRLELVFEDKRLRTRFMIARTLLVIVGNKADHELLRPKVPYQPRKKSARQPELKVVEGEQAPSLKAIPYIIRLPEASIPKHLEKILSTGSRKELVDSLNTLFLPQAFTSETYSKYFKTLLWTEEFQMNRDLERYDIPKAQLSRHNQYHYLDVPGLAEKRPSVLIGDRILVQRNNSPEGHWFSGGVHFVRKEEVGLRFHSSFVQNPSDRFLVRFKLNRYPLRRQHQALDSAFSQERVLFPATEHLSSAPIPRSTSLKVHNGTIASNSRQLQAVASIARSPSGAVPFVLFGPPGTGKTVTMVEAIRQILDGRPGARVLACAPSNSAADLIAQRLMALGEDVLFRAYAPSRHKEQVPLELLPFTYRNDNGHFSVPPLARMKRFRVIVTTCISASIVSGIGIPRGHYSHIFVDEAGQATEPEVMVSIKNMADNDTNVILCGDPKQLGPIIRSTIAQQLGLEVSFIERLMNREIYDVVKGHGKSVVKLTKNYRSHNAILKFPNERFYGGDLEPCADRRITELYTNSTHVVSKGFPIVFYSISGKDDREASSPSFFNIDEVTVVKSVVEKLRSDRRIRISDDDIGVIAPYHAQVLKLRTAFRNFADYVKIGSVEEFQGQERKVIIVSTVRSSRDFVEYDLRHTLGFVANPRRFNVAVTRAQSLLVIVGDPSVLSLDPLWRSFLNYVHTNGGWKGPEPSWDCEEPVDEAGGYDARYRDAACQDMNEFSRMMEALTLNGVASEEDGDDDGNVDRPWTEME